MCLDLLLLNQQSSLFQIKLFFIIQVLGLGTAVLLVEQW